MIALFEQFLFYSLFVAIPFQIRRVIYYPGWRFNEWMAVSIWATDIIIVLLLSLWLWDSFKNKKLQFRTSWFDYRSPQFWLILFLALAGVSIFNAPLRYLSIYSWLRLLEFILFFIYLKNYAFQKFDFFKIALALGVGGFFQGVLAIAQFTIQKNVGFYSFGEGILNPFTPGVAVFYNFAGEKIMRAYGTTPHPNILAGYMLLVLFACYYLWCWHGHLFQDKKFKNLFYVLYGAVLFGFLLTFSRTTIFIWILVSLFLLFWFWYKEKGFKGQIYRLLILTVVVCALFSVFYWQEIAARMFISKSEEAVQLRVYFAQESVDKDWNWLGIGPGNFVKWLMLKNPGKPDWMYQPVHNIYLLIYSELGIFGFTAFLGFVGLAIKRFIILSGRSEGRMMIAAIAGAILFIGIFDHFLLTLQQGRILLWLVLAALWQRTQVG